MASSKKKARKSGSHTTGFKRGSPEARRAMMVKMASYTHAMLASPTRKIDEKQRDKSMKLLTEVVDGMEKGENTRAGLETLNQFLLSVHMMARKNWVEDEKEQIASAGMVVTGVLYGLLHGKLVVPPAGEIQLVRNCISDVSEWVCELTEREFSMLSVEGFAMMREAMKKRAAVNYATTAVGA